MEAYGSEAEVQEVVDKDDQAKANEGIAILYKRLEEAEAIARRMRNQFERVISNEGYYEVSFSLANLRNTVKFYNDDDILLTEVVLPQQVY